MTENFRALRVLVVEDELLIRWAIAETLAQAGHTVVEAADGATAVMTLKSEAQRIDAVVLDCRLPDSDDLTLVATVRRLAPSSPVVLMTAFGSPELVKDAFDLGVYRVLHKPFEMHDLEALLREACGAGS